MFSGVLGQRIGGNSLLILARWYPLSALGCAFAWNWAALLAVLPVQPLDLIPRVTAAMLSTISFFAITSRSPTSPGQPVWAARLVKGRDRAEEGLGLPAQTEAFLVLVLVDPVPPVSVE